MTLSPDKGLGRARYAIASLVLFALKIAVDLGIARAFARPYSILFYVSPSDAPLFRPKESVAAYRAGRQLS